MHIQFAQHHALPLQAVKGLDRITAACVRSCCLQGGESEAAEQEGAARQASASVISQEEQVRSMLGALMGSRADATAGGSSGAALRAGSQDSAAGPGGFGGLGGLGALAGLLPGGLGAGGGPAAATPFGAAAAPGSQTGDKPACPEASCVYVSSMPGAVFVCERRIVPELQGADGFSIPLHIRKSDAGADGRHSQGHAAEGEERGHRETAGVSDGFLFWEEQIRIWVMMQNQAVNA